MLNSRFSYFKLYRLYTKVIIVALFGVGFLSVFILSLPYLVKFDESEPVKRPIVLAEKKIKLNPLHRVPSLSHQYTAFLTEDVKNQLKVFGINHRIDAEKTSLGVFLGFETFDGQRFVKLKTPYYLKYSKGKVSFSEEKTSLCLSVTDIKKEGALMKVVFLPFEGFNIQPFQEEFVAFFDKSGESLLDQKYAFSDWYKSIFSLKCFEVDKFLKLYSSDEEDRYILDKEGGFLFVQDKDLLIWKDQKWQRPSLDDRTQDYPLLSVRAAALGLTLAFFDQSGLFHKTVFLPFEKVPFPKMNFEEVFIKPRLMGLNKVTCKLNHKTVLLKEGDWVLKTPLGWKILKSLEDMQKYLDLKIKGELFVFEKIEKDQKQAVMLGKLFNSMRTSYQQVKLPLTKAQKNKHLNSKKKSYLSKLDSTEESEPQTGDELEASSFEEEEELLRYNQ